MQKKWWMEAVVYEIYPRSFMDSNGDGIGDLKGVISKLDYLKDLGITAIWICPFYKSPMDDNGYDVSDYYDISPDYGTMEDVKTLIDELTKRDMKLIVDLVLNHTSDEHPWFMEARQSKDSEYRDYYLWQDPKEDGSAPTNWESFFGGSVWHKDELTNQYYMKLFSKKMPDLNWQNEKVRKELYDIAKYWIELGADGFRVDAVAHIEKDQNYPQGHVVEGRPYSPAYHYYSNLPKVHDYIQEFNQEVLSKYDVMTVGEAGGASDEEALKYSGYDRNEFNMLIAFDHCWVDEDHSETRIPFKWTQTKVDLVKLKHALSRWQTTLHGKAWNTIFWSNHDQPRVLSHYGNDSEEYRVLSAKMLATSLYFMYGTPYIYQGEEIGMTNVAYEQLEDYNDVEIYTFHDNAIKAGLTHEEAMQRIHARSRDNARTPIQWDTTTNAGFSTGTPWLKVNENYKVINVESQINNPDSIFNHYKQILSLRQQHKGLIYGSFELLLENDPNVFAYKRYYEGNEWLVVCNFFENEVHASLNEQPQSIMLSNYKDSSLNVENITLRAYEAICYQLK